MAKTEPGRTDIKKLFALSGNRCAFPKCPIPLFLDGVLVGEVCHIKGEKPGAARYDQSQSAEERHAYSNLILMCATHHTVIDDDDTSYTVERLANLKSEHEAASTPLQEEEANRITQLYIQTVNIQSAPDVTNAARTQQAIEALWNIVVNLRNEFSLCVYYDTLFTQDEFSSYFAGELRHPAFDVLAQYRDIGLVMRTMASAGADGAARERPFVSERLYSCYQSICAVLGRSAALHALSYKEKKFHDWRNDELIGANIRAILPSSIIDAMKARQTYGLEGVIEELEQRFLAEARALRASKTDLL